jgi:site-specific DNA-methyltransferase (adenine-specific)
MTTIKNTTGSKAVNEKSIAVSGGNLVQYLIELQKMNTEQKTNNNTSPAIAAMQCYAQPSIQLFNCDNRILMQTLADESVDIILTDPPYLYLKNQKLEREFDEQLFFSECKRVLAKKGFIVMFGRGTSFYLWNTILDDLGFNFKEEIVWNKSYNTSPLLALSRIHETISIFTKGKGTINRVKVPYLEMKSHDLDSVIGDVKRLRTILKNTKSLDAVLEFLENNKVPYNSDNVLSTSISSIVQTQDRCASVFSGIQNGVNEKSVINIYDYNSSDRVHNDKHNVVASPKLKNGDRSVAVISNIIDGQNEKSIIKQVRDHYSTIHPTQKPVRLLERLLALVIPQDKPKEEITILDPFGGSFSTMEAVYNMGMQGIACEIDEEYFEAGKKRIEKLPPRQAVLFE